MLFQESAVFVQPSAELVVAGIDARVRRMRNMPSCSDGSMAAVFAGMRAVQQAGTAWLEAAPPEGDCRGMLARIQRACQAISAGISEESARRMIRHIARDIPPQFLLSLPMAGLSKEDTLHSLITLSSMLFEHSVSKDVRLRKRYLKRLYRVVDDALQFNSTTDTVRVRGVLNWIRDILEREGRTGCLYADIGCAMATGAPGVFLAERVLCRGGLCRRVHGVDVVAPAREFAREALSLHRIYLYVADPVRRPLTTRYDAILLANVHRHLDRRLQERMLENLGQSLADQGMLFVNWRFDDSRSPCLCLKRFGEEVRIVAENNCV